jgi:pilus assembly protein CpaF
VTVVVQVARFNDGSRRVTHITEITGMEVDIVSMQDVFLFEKQGLSPEGRVLGTFTATGIRPRFEEKLNAAGIARPSNFFEPSVKYRRG